MSGKLNQSLEEILKDKRSSGPRTGRGGRPRRGAKATTTKVAAPAGGIKKNTRPTRNAAKQAPAKGAKGSRGSVIQIGNLVGTTSIRTGLELVPDVDFSLETPPKPRSRYVIDEALAAFGIYVDTYIPSRIMST